MSIQDLKNKFFQDPDWKEVEKLLMDYVTPLIQMDSVDVKQPAEHVKAELIARQLAYEGMCKFLEQTGMVTDTKAHRPTTTFK